MTKEEVQIGDVLIYKKYAKFAKVTEIEDDCILVNEREFIPIKQLKYWSKFINPIKNNRIVNDETFAVRFKQFLEWIPKNWWMSQPHYYEEYNYIIDVAEKLLKYQIETATSENEIEYLKELKLL